MFDRIRLIERRLEPVSFRHAQIHSCKVADRRDNDLRYEWQRSDHYPRCDRAVVGTERGAASDVIVELPLDAIDHSLAPTGPVTCREPTTVLPVADEILRIANRILLLHKRCLPGVLEIVGPVVTHVGVPYASKVNPHVRQL